MSYILILIFAGQYVVTSSSAPFQTKELCEAAKTQIVTEYSNRKQADRFPQITAYCVQNKENDNG